MKHWCCAALGSALLLGAMPVHAADEPPIFQHYRAHAEQLRRERYANALGYGIVGAGTVVTALAVLPEDEWPRTYTLFVGGFSLGIGVVNLLVPTSGEVTARELVGSDGRLTMSAQQLHDRWKVEAERARTFRLMLGGLSLGIGAAQTAVGVYALAAEDPNLTDSERSNLAAFGLIGGAIFLGAGGATLVVPSSTEQTFSDFDAAHPNLAARASEFRFGVVPAAGGAAVVMSGIF